MSVQQYLTDAAGRAGINPLELLVLAQLESSMNPNAKNPKSSAGGLYQFVDATAAQYGLHGRSRYDLGASTDAAIRLTNDNRRALRNVLGRDPSVGELYLAHQQGAGGATALLSNPGARAHDVLTQVYGGNAEKAARVLQLNGGNIDMSTDQFAGLWMNKANNAARRFDPNFTGEDVAVATQLDVTPPQGYVSHSTPGATSLETAINQVTAARDTAGKLFQSLNDNVARNTQALMQDSASVGRSAGEAVRGASDALAAAPMQVMQSSGQTGGQLADLLAGARNGASSAVAAAGDAATGAISEWTGNAGQGILDGLLTATDASVAQSQMQADTVGRLLESIGGAGQSAVAGFGEGQTNALNVRSAGMNELGRMVGSAAQPIVAGFGESQTNAANSQVAGVNELGRLLGGLFQPQQTPEIELPNPLAMPSMAGGVPDPSSPLQVQGPPMPAGPNPLDLSQHPGVPRHESPVRPDSFGSQPLTALLPQLAPAGPNPLDLSQHPGVPRHESPVRSDSFGNQPLTALLPQLAPAEPGAPPDPSGLGGLVRGIGALLSQAPQLAQGLGSTLLPYLNKDSAAPAAEAGPTANPSPWDQPGPPMPKAGPPMPPEGNPSPWDQPGPPMPKAGPPMPPDGKQSAGSSTPPAERSAPPAGRSGSAASAARSGNQKTFRGAHSGREYVVGQEYEMNGDRYVLQEDGKFRNLRTGRVFDGAGAQNKK